MADSTQAEKILNLATAGLQLNPNELHGRLRVGYFQHTCESETASSVIRLTRVPAGARIVGLIWASEDLSAGAATLDIGDSSDVDRLIAGLDVGTAALGYSLRALRSPSTETPDVGIGYAYSSETWIQATVNTASLNTGKFWGFLLYVVD